MDIQTWQADPTRSELSFKLRHLVLSEIAGRVGSWRAALTLDFERPERSSVEAVIDARSLDTQDPERDDHVRSAEFLNTAVFPDIRFTSTLITRTDDRHYQVAGELTVRDVTRSVTLEAEDLGRKSDPSSQNQFLFRVRGTLNRRDFGLKWNQDLDTGGVVVGDNVSITVALAIRPMLAVVSDQARVLPFSR